MTALLRFRTVHARSCLLGHKTSVSLRVHLPTELFMPRRFDCEKHDDFTTALFVGISYEKLGKASAEVFCGNL